VISLPDKRARRSAATIPNRAAQILASIARPVSSTSRLGLDCASVQEFPAQGTWRAVAPQANITRITGTHIAMMYERYVDAVLPTCAAGLPRLRQSILRRD
jgi:hypothetical protein